MSQLNISYPKDPDLLHSHTLMLCYCSWMHDCEKLIFFPNYVTSEPSLLGACVEPLQCPRWNKKRNNAVILDPNHGLQIKGLMMYFTVTSPASVRVCFGLVIMHTHIQAVTALAEKCWDSSFPCFGKCKMDRFELWCVVETIGPILGYLWKAWLLLNGYISYLVSHGKFVQFLININVL